MKDGSYHYAVQMTVPRGKRNGALEMRIHENTIMGFLTMFTERLPITRGSCSGNQIRFAGQMKTLLNTFGYEAAGTISPSRIDLVFHTDGGDYPAIGYRRTETV